MDTIYWCKGVYYIHNGSELYTVYHEILASENI